MPDERATPASGAGSAGPAPPTLDPPSEVREIAATLERAGFETWCVGGAIRDALLGLAHLDWDLATAATPDQMQRLFRRTVPKGEEFGTIGVFDRRGRQHDVTSFRRDVRTDGRHAEVAFGVSLDEDLARRDLTINAIAFSPATGQLHDPFGGQEDLARGIVRAVGEPHQRMLEDRLRALRALRFASRFGFRIDPATWTAIVASAPYLHRLSRERVKEELEKTMEQVCHPSRALELWRSAGALRALLPELEEQPGWVFAATDRVALPDATSDEGRGRRRTLLRLATLFVGRPLDVTRRLLRELRFSNRDAEWLGRLAANASSLRAELPETTGPGTAITSAALRRWASRSGRTALPDTLRVAIATAVAERGQPGAAGATLHAVYRQALRTAFSEPVEIADLAVDGDDLMREAGLSPGPSIGKTLRRLLDAVLDDPSLNSRAALLELSRRWQSADQSEGR